MISEKMKPNASGTNPKVQTQALTDNSRSHRIIKQPPEVDPQGVNPPNPRQKKKTKIQSKRFSEKVELDRSGTNQ